MASTSASPRRPKKPRKTRTVTISVASSTPTHIPPVIAYFPTGYDPTTAAAPDLAVFRRRNLTSHLDLVVSPPQNPNVTFVGSSYSGEAQAPQFCSYALGVLDKKSNTLKIVPVAGKKILRMEPKFADVENGVDAGEEIITGTRAELTQMFGTKRSKRMAELGRSLRKQRNDPSPSGTLNVKTSDPSTDGEPVQEAEGMVTRNIPPHDLSAIIPEKAYPLGEIILNAEWDKLKATMHFLRKGSSLEENDFPCFVNSRINKLQSIKDAEEKLKYAGILDFIIYLVRFWNLGIGKKSQYPPAVEKIPTIIYRRFLRIFTDPETNTLSSETKELLIGYILVLTLFADNFFTETTEIAKDLGMTRESIIPYYIHLGCKSTKSVGGVGVSKKNHMQLSAPLVFVDQKKRQRDRRR